MAEKKLPKKAIRELIRNGETSEPVKGFKSKAGKSFQARLRVDKKSRRVEMVFE